MKRLQVFIPGALALAGAACLVAACGEDSVAPDPSQAQAAPSAAVASAATPIDRYIVLLKSAQPDRITASAVQTDLARLGGRIERAHSEIGVLQVRGLTRAAAAELAKRPDVEAVAQDRKLQWIPPGEQAVFGRKVATQTNQRDAEFFRHFQWNLKRIKAPQAWDVSRQGRSTAVCILDTGVDPRQIDLAGKLNLEISASFVGTERADRDLFFHGTAMASVVATNGIALASVAPDAKLCSVKVLDRTGFGTFGDVAAGIMYVGDVGRTDPTTRVTVANMSLNALVPRNDPGIQALIKATQRAIDYSTRKGVLFVASAGNQAVNLNDPDLISLPAQLDHVLSVGATGPIGQRQFDHVASYSNVGRRGVDVFAPGGEFAFGGNVLEDLILLACSPSTRLPGLEVCADRNIYVFVAGTSPAAAHVSGEAAVIESELPGDQTPAELTACILGTADPLPHPALTANGRINVLAGQACATPLGTVATR